ncbi:MAG: hypothetical protein F6K41_05405 [Symploca sp. SIO3E6]|nr:hypothetical protein [Caldora sp. SIO3E6]
MATTIKQIAHYLSNRNQLMGRRRQLSLALCPDGVTTKLKCGVSGVVKKKVRIAAEESLVNLASLASFGKL